MKESGETYLETILLLSQNGPVRAVDVAAALGYSKPSVSRALGILKDSGLVVMERSGLRLTAAGRLAAGAIYERHRIITEFLANTLQLPKELAEQDACRIEHIISDETFERMKQLTEQNNEN